MLTSMVGPARISRSIRTYAVSYTAVLKKKTKRGTTDKTSRDNILHRDITSELTKHQYSLQQVKIPKELIVDFLYVKSSRDVQLNDVSIIGLTSDGLGIGFVLRKSYDETCTDDSTITVVTVPKTVVGDVVSIRLRRHYEYYAEAELISVSRKSAKHSIRNDRMVLCQHFQTCSGCQFQMIPYGDQLEFKKNVIASAYHYFYPGLNLDEVEFGDVVESPMQYAYRTKITPHTQVKRDLTPEQLPLPVGFDTVGPGRSLVDVEACPIAVPTINKMLPTLKENFQKDVEKYLGTDRKGKLISDFIMRDSIRIDHSTGEYENVCLTKRNNVITEQVGEFVFQFEANEFFQNNRSILPSFLDFIRYQLSEIEGGFSYLVDAYCGSGFLGISLSNTLPEHGKVFGIEIAKKSIDYAHHNAKINGLYEPDKIEFVQGNSDSMFTNEAFLKSGLVGPDCVLLMNPSRKGSTKEFMKQVLTFKPKAIVYVSCNAFTQARDLSDFADFQLDSSTKYRIKSITGFDFYPQTKHVESVAVLELVE